MKPVLAILVALAIGGCAASRRPGAAPEDVERCVRNGGPFRLDPPIVAYRGEGGPVDQGRIVGLPGVLKVSPFVMREAGVGQAPPRPILVRGVDFTSSTGQALARSIVSGAVPTPNPAAPHVLVGHRLAAQEHVSAGQTIRLTVQGATGGQRTVEVAVAGVFRVGVAEQDAGAIFIHVDEAMKLFQLPNPTGLAVEAATLDDATRVRELVATALGPDVRVRDWRDLNRRTLEALSSQLGLADVSVATLDERLPLVCAALGQHAP